MGFYFVIYTFLGIVAASSNILIIEGRKAPGAVPMWVHSIGSLFVLLGLGACASALITSLINQDLIWSIIAVAEIALGFILAWMLPTGLRALIVVTSPISVVAILGALWGFWYIGF